MNLAIDTILTINVSTGIGRFRVVADPFDNIGEANEGNNQLESGPTAFTALGSYGFVFGFFTDASGDTLDLLRFVSQPGDGILLYSIPDTASSASTSTGIDPSLRLFSATNNGIGGDLDDINLITFDLSEPRLGTRIITGGEIIGILAGSTAENNQLLIEPAKGTAGRAQIVIQSCVVIASGYGMTTTDSIIGSDCILWPNPVSGVRTRGAFVSFTAAAGDSVNLSLISDSVDTVLLLFGPDGDLVKIDDDGGTGINSLLAAGGLVPGNHMVLVTTYDLLDTGPWSLEISGPNGVFPSNPTLSPSVSRTERQGAILSPAVTAPAEPPLPKRLTGN